MRERRVTRSRAKSDGSQTLPRYRNPTCHDFQTSAATWIRFCLPARDEIPVDILTARDTFTLFVLRTVRRQLFPTQVTRRITAQRLVAGSRAARRGDAIALCWSPGNRIVVVYGRNRRSNCSNGQHDSQVDCFCLRRNESDEGRVNRVCVPAPTCGTAFVSCIHAYTAHSCPRRAEQIPRLPVSVSPVTRERHPGFSHTCIPNAIATLTPHFSRRGYDAQVPNAA